MIGIYKIVDHKERLYIGSSKNIHKRFLTHKRDLLHNRHHNIHLQRVYDKYGIGVFRFEIIEETTLDRLFEREQFHIDNNDNLFNIGSVGGGDNISNHPLYDELKLKLGNILRTCKKPEPRYGKDNPNWRGGLHKCITCGIDISRSHTTCINCRDISGKNNPFYGKTHSDETKNKLSEKAKQRAKDGKIPTNARKILVNGVMYNSLAEFSRSSNISPSLCIYRIKSHKWDYKYVD